MPPGAVEAHAEVAAVPEGFADRGFDPRRGVLWAGAAPMDAGAGRIGAGIAGGWFATWTGLQVAGGAAEIDAAWAPTERLAFTVTGAAATGILRAAPGEGGLAPLRGWAGIVGARWLVVDAPRARVAPFVVAGLGAGRLGSASGLVVAGGAAPPVGIVGGGLAFEVPYYAVTFDAAVPIGGVVMTGTLPDLLPLTPGPFAPLFLLAEAGFTWKLGPTTSFRLGYVALSTSWSWRWRPGPFSLEVTGYTNVLTGNLSVRGGWIF